MLISGRRIDRSGRCVDLLRTDGALRNGQALDAVLHVHGATVDDARHAAEIAVVGEVVAAMGTQNQHASARRPIGRQRGLGAASKSGVSGRSRAGLRRALLLRGRSVDVPGRTRGNSCVPTVAIHNLGSAADAGLGRRQVRTDPPPNTDSRRSASPATVAEQGDPG